MSHCYPTDPWDDGGRTRKGASATPSPQWPCTPHSALQEQQNSSERSQGGAAGEPRVRAGGEAAHLGHDASLVQEQAAEASGFLGDGVSVEPRQAVPQRQVLCLIVLGGCPGVAGHKIGEKKRSEEEGIRGNMPRRNKGRKRSEEEASWLSRQ